MVDEKTKTETAEDLVLSAIKVLQRGLLPGDLDDRQVMTELWGIFDGEVAREIYHRTEGSRPAEA